MLVAGWVLRLHLMLFPQSGVAVGVMQIKGMRGLLEDLVAVAVAVAVVLQEDLLVRVLQVKVMLVALGMELGKITLVAVAVALERLVLLV